MVIDSESTVGKQFGRWKVLEEIKQYRKYDVYCRCLCECGTEKMVARYSLRNGDSKSCGCDVDYKYKTTRKSIVGLVFGRLRVVEMLWRYKGNRTYCKCICECGKEHIASKGNLTTGHTTSCGCLSTIRESRRIDIVGEKYGMLTVLETIRKEDGRTYSRCQCDCGSETVALQGNVKRGLTKSCGCYEKSSRHTRTHFLDIIRKTFNLLTVVEKTSRKEKNGAVIWKCQCNCGNYTETTYSNLKLNRVRSCGCDKYSSMIRDIANQRFGMLVALHEVESPDGKSLWRCKCDCGNEKNVVKGYLTSGNTMSCGCNSSSSGEIFLAVLLKQLNIEFIREYKFAMCVNKRPLPFDFYLPRHNICIEYQGKQHYEPIEYFGGSERYETRVHNDKIKRDYCLANDIHLVCLPYTLSNDEIAKIITEATHQESVTSESGIQ